MRATWLSRCDHAPPVAGHILTKLRAALFRGQALNGTSKRTRFPKKPRCHCGPHSARLHHNPDAITHEVAKRTALLVCSERETFKPAAGFRSATMLGQRNAFAKQRGDLVFRVSSHSL